MTSERRRPKFIISASDVAEETERYPGSDEDLSFGRALGRAAGLERLGAHLERLPPGRRTSYPHAEGDLEELVYVLEGEIDLWVDGDLHRMVRGDFAAFPAGTGIAHTALNNGEEDALLFVAGERTKPGSRLHYPLNPEVLEKIPSERRWKDVPKRTLGPHNGKPRRP
jgi:uncharacterized cupin superfamily protein